MYQLLVSLLILVSCSQINVKPKNCYENWDLDGISFRIDGVSGADYSVMVVEHPIVSIIGTRMMWSKKSFHRNFNRRVKCRK